MIVAKDLVELIDTAVASIGGVPRRASLEPRRHLGASVIGKKCERAIYYGWRWFSFERFSGRMLRLFQRGQDEEPRFIELLHMIPGVKVVDVAPGGKQWRFVGYRGHFGGSMDGIITGLQYPAARIAPEMRGVCEFKTHNAKSFANLQNKRLVRIAKPEHYVQMQVYLKNMDLHYGLYMAVNKDTDDLYIEIVGPDAAVAKEFEDRAVRLVESRVVPPRIPYASPSNFDCTFCAHRGVCHMGAAPLKNCRSCALSDVADEGRFFCRRWSALIPEDKEIRGCAEWIGIE